MREGDPGEPIGTPVDPMKDEKQPKWPLPEPVA